jgi:N-acetylglucosaminyldiphosphoundecaprenol N-acetyl-beta-D-mannosaminyltransferase
LQVYSGLMPAAGMNCFPSIGKLLRTAGNPQQRLLGGLRRPLVERLLGASSPRSLRRFAPCSTWHAHCFPYLEDDGLAGGRSIRSYGHVGQSVSLQPSQQAPLGAENSNPSFALLGVELANLSVDAALGMVFEQLRARDTTSLFFFANAHTLDLAVRCESFRRTLGQASCVLSDGIGIRIGAWVNGVTLADNLCGTEFIPRLLSIESNPKFSYYLLGATRDSIADAAQEATASFPSWHQVGFHHGYLQRKDSSRVVKKINAARPDLLLVGMGSPLQEQWLVENRCRLRVPVCAGVGGLFDFWSGRRTRAPLLLRKSSLEWLYIALTEPHKWRRYAFGAPRYLAYVAMARLPMARRALT